MVYLIQDCYKDSKGNYIDILKIGYSKDSFSITREKAYNTHNYGYKFLGEREGDTSLESYFHKYFDKYKINKDSEWFYYNDEIVNNFYTLEIVENTLSKEDFIELIKNQMISKINTPNSLYKNNIDELLKELKEEYDKNYSSLYEFNVEEIKNVIINTFNVGYKILTSYWESHNYLDDEIMNDLPETIKIEEVNSWKNRVELYYKMTREDNIKSVAEFTEYLNIKQERTEKLLKVYSDTKDSFKHDLAEKYQEGTKSFNYKNDYIAVNTHAGSDLKPVFNKLVMLSEIRAFEIQQIDYSNRFRLFNSLKSSDKVEYDNEVANIIECIDLLPYFNQKMKYLYDLNMSEELAKRVFDTLLETDFAKYYYSISKEKAGTLKYNKKQLEKEYDRLNSISSTIDLENLPIEIYSNFTVSSRYSKSYIKEKLKEIYDKLGYSKTAKANDIEEYFEVKECRVLNTTTNKRDSGFELIRKIK